MAERLWSNPGNPPRWVAEQLRLSLWDFPDALHKIKRLRDSAAPTESPYGGTVPLPTVAER